MKNTHKQESRRRIDVASLILLLIGIAFGVFSYWLIVAEQFNFLIIVPSIVSITIGASHLSKRELSQHHV